jgi:hypothetical protein
MQLTFPAPSCFAVSARTRAVHCWQDSKWEDAPFRGARLVQSASLAASELWLRTIVPNPSLALLVTNHTTSNSQSKQQRPRRKRCDTAIQTVEPF